MLTPDGLHLQDAGDLGDRVGVVGGLEVAGEQRVLADRLRRELGVDARRAQEQQPLGAVRDGGVHHVDLDLQVLGEEVDRVGVVGEDAADLGGRQHHVARLGLGEEREHLVAVLEVQLGRGPADQRGEALPLEVAPDGGADQPAVTGDIERCGALEGSGSEVGHLVSVC